MVTKTQPKIIDSKFSILEEHMVEELRGFIKYLVSQWCNPNSMEFDPQELEAELLLELVKGIKYYQGKIDNPDQLKAALRRILDNRISELRYKVYRTHRSVARFNISIEVEFDENAEEMVADKGPSPEDVYDSLNRVNTTRSRLSPTAQNVFDACIYGDQRLELLSWLCDIRSSCSGRKVTTQVKPWLLAEALALPIRTIEKAFKEIRDTYKEVCCE